MNSNNEKQKNEESNTTDSLVLKKTFKINDKLSLDIFLDKETNEEVFGLDHFQSENILLFKKESLKKLAELVFLIESESDVLKKLKEYNQ